jgi:hypothetical protein
MFLFTFRSILIQQFFCKYKTGSSHDQIQAQMNHPLMDIIFIIVVFFFFHKSSLFSFILVLQLDCCVRRKVPSMGFSINWISNFEVMSNDRRKSTTYLHEFSSYLLLSILAQDTFGCMKTAFSFHYRIQNQKGKNWIVNFEWVLTFPQLIFEDCRLRA